MTRWSLEDLDRMLLLATTNPRPAAYVAALERQRAELLERQRVAMAGEVAGLLAAGLPELEADPGPVPPEPEEAPFDLGMTVDGLMRFWRGKGLGALQRKAGRGDLKALALLAQLTRTLSDLDDDRQVQCSRPCCKKPPREIRVSMAGSAEAREAEQRAAANPRIEIFYAEFPDEGSKV